MPFRNFVYAFAVIVAFSVVGLSQATKRTASVPDSGSYRGSAAYAEVLLRKTELQADLEALSADYTDTNPKLIDTRFEIAVLEKEIARLAAVPTADSQKLTLGLGKLMVKKAELETELNRLNRGFSKEHPEVKRQTKRVELFDAAINDILR